MSYFRAKYHKLKFGNELVQGGGEPPPGLLDDLSEDGGGRLDGAPGDTTTTAAAILSATNSNASWKQSRQLLRQSVTVDTVTCSGSYDLYCQL